MALAVPAQERAAVAPVSVPQRRPYRPARPLLPTPRLSVIIVNYHLWHETEALVAQLLAAPCTQRGDLEVVIVDNHSPAHPLVRKLRRRPEVALRRWGSNQGFARAVNEGARLSRGRWLLLLNPDIQVTDGFLEGVLRLAADLEAREPDAGIVGFHLRNTDGSRQLSSGPFPTLAQTLLRVLLPRHRRKYQFLRARRRRRVPWVTGCCLLVRRDCLEQLGGLDRDYFLYYEDVDLCRRAQAAGWSVCFEPGLRAVHHHPLHQREVTPYLRLLTRHALLTYAAKHWPRWQSRCLSALVEFEARLRRQWARRQGDWVGAHLFARLRDIASDLGRGYVGPARRKLDQVVRGQERRRGR